LDRCPQGGDVGEAMFAIRNLTVKEGNIPEGVLAQAKSLFENGRVVTASKMALVHRERYGLGEEPSVDVEAVQKILKKTRFNKLISKGK
jgi:heterodisulfide reductase subunit C